MEHLLLKAATTATDQGTFTAVISTATIDREKDIVDADGMVKALQKWTETGKRIPLLWHHSTRPEDNIGHIDPASAKAINGEVVVDGFIDQSTPRGAEAWRLVKSGTLGFSFGYLTLKGVPRAGGGMHIKELDVYEATATSTPMNGDTRVLSWKAVVSADAEDPADLLDGMLALAQAFIAAEDDPADVAVMRDIASRLQALISAEDAEDAQEDSMKAVWSTAFVNNLPDSAFLYVEPGGTKDDDGKTVPRTNRHFPYKDADGKVDVAHLRNALSRIPQAQFLSQAQKDRLTAEARRLLDNQKSAVKDPGEDPTAANPEGKEPREGKPKAQDPLRKRADAIELEFLSEGVKARKSPPPSQPKPELLPLAELKARMREEMLTLLSGGIEE